MPVSLIHLKYIKRTKWFASKNIKIIITTVLQNGPESLVDFKNSLNITTKLVHTKQIILYFTQIFRKIIFYKQNQYRCTPLRNTPQMRNRVRNSSYSFPDIVLQMGNHG